MRQNPKIGWVGSVGLLVVALAGLSTARGQDAARHQGGAGGQSVQLLIAHALDMAIEGSELQVTIRQAGSPGAAGTSDAGVSRAGGAAASGRAAGGHGQGSLMQLEQHTRRAFQESYELLKASNRMLRGGAESRDERASASRLYAAANLYANTLYSLARETFGWEAGWEPTDRSREEGGQAGRSGQGRAGAASQHGAAGARPTASDLATLTVINHAVRESLSAFLLNQSLREAGTSDVAAERLREHARMMAAEGRRSVEQTLASLREKEAAGSGGASRTAGTESHPGGWSGTQVQSLAQQAREVVRMFDELSGGAGGAAGAERRSR